MRFKKFDTMQKHLNGIHARCGNNNDNSFKDEESLKDEKTLTEKTEDGWK